MFVSCVCGRMCVCVCVYLCVNAWACALYYEFVVLIGVHLACAFILLLNCIKCMFKVFNYLTFSKLNKRA